MAQSNSSRVKSPWMAMAYRKLIIFGVAVWGQTISGLSLSSGGAASLKSNGALIRRSSNVQHIGAQRQRPFGTNKRQGRNQEATPLPVTKTSLFAHEHDGGKGEGLEHNGDAGNEDERGRWTPLSTKEKIILPCQLIFGISLLLLLPSAIGMGNIAYGAKVMGTLPYEYVAFFGLLVIPRSYRYGKFAKPIQKSIGTTKKATSITEVIAFIITLAGSHWVAAYTFALRSKSMFAPRLLLLTRLLSTVMVAFSGWYLDKSYDRVARPYELIQSGPYAIVRHPIYTSYLLLFTSTLTTLKAFGATIAMLGVAGVFYKHRMDSEEQILSDAFGADYDQYRAKVPWRLLSFLY